MYKNGERIKRGKENNKTKEHRRKIEEGNTDVG